MNSIKKLITLHIGTTFSETWNVFRSANSAFSLVGYSARASMRPHWESNVVYNFTASLDDANKTVTLQMASNTTSTITPQNYMFDVEIFNSSNVVHRIIEGRITATPEITR